MEKIMDKNFKCQFLSWEGAWNLSKVTAKKIIQSGYEPDMIIGVTRGGWVPAMNLSDLLGIKDLLALKVEHWGITATKSKKAELKFPLRTDLTGKNILLVDDLTDTGESVKISTEHIKTLNPREIKTATLLHKSQSIFEPDFYAKEIREWVWIILPWNLTEDLCNLVKRVLERRKEIGKEMDLDEIQNSLMERFDLKVDKETLKEILEELKRRNHQIRRNL